MERFFGRVIISLIILVCFFMLAMPALAIDSEGDTNNPTVIITDYTVTPAVLLPGDKGFVTLNLKNTAQTASIRENSGITYGGEIANTKNTDISVYIERVQLEGNDITVLTDAFDRLGSLGPGQSVEVTFVIQAPYSKGIFFPEAQIDVKDGRSTRYPVMVNVDTDITTQKKPALSVHQSLPDRVAPGEDCMVGISIINTGLTRASDIAVIVNSTTKSLVLTSPGRYYYEHLDPDEMTNISLHFITDKNTPLGIDPVTVTITYLNPDQSDGKQTEIIGIPMKGKAEIAIKSFSTDPSVPAPGGEFTLITRVENTGTDKATSVRATLESPLTGTKTAFIGSIDKNSDAPAIFYLQATRDGNIPVNVTIDYSDDFGSHVISEQAGISTKSSSLLIPVIGIIILAGLIFGGVYWYYRIKPGKQNGS